jgi:hypothetical protein
MDAADRAESVESGGAPAWREKPECAPTMDPALNDTTPPRGGVVSLRVRVMFWDGACGRRVARTGWRNGVNRATPI